MNDRCTNKVLPDDREAALIDTPLPRGCALGRTWFDAAVRTCELYGVDMAGVLSMARHAHHVRVRAQAWADLIGLGYSYTEVARGWCVDHSTVIDIVKAHHPGVARARTLASRPGLRRAMRAAEAERKTA